MSDMPRDLAAVVDAFGPHLNHRGGARAVSDVEPERLVDTHCCFCGQQCGIKLKVKDNEVVGFEPRYDSPFNEGKLCPKGVKRYLQGSHPDRLLEPLERLPALASVAGPVAVRQTETGRLVANTALHNRELKRILQCASLVYCDGAGIVVGSRWLGQPLPCRLTAADFFIDMIRDMAAHGCHFVECFWYVLLVIIESFFLFAVTAALPAAPSSSTLLADAAASESDARRVATYLADRFRSPAPEAEEHGGEVCRQLGARLPRSASSLPTPSS